jgi:dihydroorotate dehydrogenase electron transfer subunit
VFKPAKKTSTRALSEKYYYVELSLLEDLGTEPRPLQFVNIWIPGVDEVPMSISHYEEKRLYVLFKVVGEGTRSLRDRVGFFGVKGPLGNGLLLSGYRRVLFVAGGAGVAPLPLLARHAEECGVELDAVWGVKKSSELFNVKSLAPSVRAVYYATEDCGVGYCGTAAELAKRILSSSEREYDLVVSVGPKSMLLEICRAAQGLLRVLVSLEALVKCGLGACGSCTLKPLPKLLCVDGPVFECSEVVRHLEWASRD